MTDTIDRDRWREIDAVFQEALEHDPSDRESFLDDRCPDDPQLRRAVLDLLAADRGAADFLEGSAEAIAPEGLAQALRAQATVSELDRSGERVGAFQVTRLIGRGGMAAVYEAERADGEFEQRVAIKFLRRGLDTEDFIRRFVAERQILSSLQHPNIARLVDGGRTAEGFPYLALEYVEGDPITRYCDEANCSLEERLRLFVQVARAVQHAHTNLIVHRDIKPSNILVTAEGRVKLLDFGIAKLLEEEASPTEAPLTRTGFRPLTPEYASPEQVRGKPITTASDVYQLGVLLYRLLTGDRPYQIDTTGSTLEEAITQTRPRPPSEAVRRRADAATLLGLSPARLGRRLRGDLDTIVLKTLRKDPNRRYATAQEMADDLERHLADLPIAARPESAAYRAGKFLTRHAWLAPVAAAAIVAAGAYVFTLIRYGARLEEERNVAQDVQEAFVGFFTAPDSGDVGLGEGRRDLTILQAIQDGRERVRAELADRPQARAELFTAMAAVLEDLDEPAQAYELASEALALEGVLYGEESPQVHETLLLVGRLTENPDSARAVLERQLELSEALYGAEDPATAVSLHALAELDLRQGKLEDAIDHLEDAIVIYRTTPSVHPRRLGDALAELAETQATLGRDDVAVGTAREGYDILAQEFGARHSQTAMAGARLARALTGAGRFEEARPVYEASLDVMDTELGPTHATTMSTRNNFAILLRFVDDVPGSEAVYRELLVALRERYGAVHEEVAASIQNLSVAVKDQGRYEEAERLSLAAHEMFEETRGPEHFQTAFPLLTVSEIRLIREDFSGAEASSREAVELLRAALPPGHYATAVAECRLGQALAGQGRRAESRRHLEAGLEALLADPQAEVEAYRDECVHALESL